MTHASPINRLPGLDLLRAAAICWTLLYHVESYGVPVPGLSRHGWMGVDLFFVLSGFLIGSQLLQSYADGQPLRLSEFMVRRACRVLPAYLTVLAIYLALPAFSESEGIAPLWQFLTFTANLFPDYFHHRAYSHAWSLCVEEHFYLVLPPVVWLLWQKPRRFKVVAAAMAVLIGGMILRGWLWQQEVAPYMHVTSGERSFDLRYVEVIYNPTYCRLDGLLAGVMLAVAKVFMPEWWTRAMAYGPALLFAGLAGIGVCMMADPTSLLGTVFVFPLLAFSLASVVAAALSPGTWLARFPLPGARAIAAMSFSLYLTNRQVYHWMDLHFGETLETSGLVAFVVYNGTAFAVAALLFAIVERPGLWMRDRILARARWRASPQSEVSPALASPTIETNRRAG